MERTTARSRGRGRSSVDGHDAVAAETVLPLGRGKHGAVKGEQHGSTNADYGITPAKQPAASDSHSDKKSHRSHTQRIRTSSRTSPNKNRKQPPKRLPQMQLRNVDGVHLINKLVTLIGTDPTRCDIVVKSRTCEPQHAMLLYDISRSTFTIKDLDTTVGTFRNNLRLSTLTPVEDRDILRFGSDPKTYRIESLNHLPDLLYDPATETYVFPDKLKRPVQQPIGSKEHRRKSRSQRKDHRSTDDEHSHPVLRIRQTISSPPEQSGELSRRAPAAETVDAYHSSNGDRHSVHESALPPQRRRSHRGRPREHVVTTEYVVEGDEEQSQWLRNSLMASLRDSLHDLHGEKAIARKQAHSHTRRGGNKREAPSSSRQRRGAIAPAHEDHHHGGSDADTDSNGSGSESDYSVDSMSSSSETEHMGGGNRKRSTRRHGTHSTAGRQGRSRRVALRDHVKRHVEYGDEDRSKGQERQHWQRSATDGPTSSKGRQHRRQQGHQPNSYRASTEEALRNSLRDPQPRHKYVYHEKAGHQERKILPAPPSLDDGRARGHRHAQMFHSRPQFLADSIDGTPQQLSKGAKQTPPKFAAPTNTDEGHHHHHRHHDHHHDHQRRSGVASSKAVRDHEQLFGNVQLNSIYLEQKLETLAEALSGLYEKADLHLPKTVKHGLSALEGASLISLAARPMEPVEQAEEVMSALSKCLACVSAMNAAMPRLSKGVEEAQSMSREKQSQFLATTASLQQELRELREANGRQQSDLDELRAAKHARDTHQDDLQDEVGQAQRESAKLKKELASQASKTRELKSLVASLQHQLQHADRSRVGSGDTEQHETMIATDAQKHNHSEQLVASLEQQLKDIEHERDLLAANLESTQRSALQTEESASSRIKALESEVMEAHALHESVLKAYDALLNKVETSGTQASQNGSEPAAVRDDADRETGEGTEGNGFGDTQDLESALPRTELELLSQVHEARTLLKESEDARSSLEHQLASVSERLERAQQQNASLHNSISVHAEEAVEQEQVETEKMQKLEDDLAQLADDNAQLRGKIEAMTGHHEAEMAAARESHASKLLQLEKELQGVTTDHGQLAEDKERLLEKVSSLEAKVEALEEAQEGYETDLAVAVERARAENKQAREQLEETVARLEVEAAALAERAEARDAEAAENAEKEAAIARLQEQVAEEKTRHETLAAQLADAQASVRLAKERIKELLECLQMSTTGNSDCKNISQHAADGMPSESSGLVEMVAALDTCMKAFIANQTESASKTSQDHEVALQAARAELSKQCELLKGSHAKELAAERKKAGAIEDKLLAETARLASKSEELQHARSLVEQMQKEKETVEGKLATLIQQRAADAEAAKREADKLRSDAELAQSTLRLREQDMKQLSRDKGELQSKVVAQSNALRELEAALLAAEGRAKEKDDDVQQLHGAMDTLRLQMSKVLDDVQTLTRERAALEEQLALADQTIHNKFPHASKRIDRLTSQLSRAQKTIEKQKALLAERGAPTSSKK